jgi:cytochrome P450
MNPLILVPGGTYLVKLWHHKVLYKVDNFIETIIDKRFAQEKEVQEQNKDLLQLMVSQMDDVADVEGVPSKVWLRDQLKLFLFAGTDTTSQTLCWLCALLALNPLIQQQVHEELDSICADDSSLSPDFQAIHKLRMLDACCKETLRLYPPANAISRVFPPDEAGSIDGTPLAQNVTVRIDIIGMHRKEEYLPCWN